MEDMDALDSLTEDDCRQALEQDPGHPAALLKLGMILMDRPDGLDEAAQLLRRLTQRLPDRAEVWIMLGGCLRLAGRDNDAEPCYRRVTELNPNSHTAWSALGLFYGMESPIAEACFVRCTELQPELPDVWLRLGQNLLSHRPQDAAAAFRRALDLDSESSEGWFWLSVALQTNPEDLPDALGALKTALRLDPEQGDWWDRLGGLYLDDLNQPAAAQEAFEKAIGCDSGNPAYSLANLFWTLLIMGRLQEAEELRSKLHDLEEVGYLLCDAALRVVKEGPDSVQEFLQTWSEREEIQGEYAVDWARLRRLAKAG